jgi:hypothetical protein
MIGYKFLGVDGRSVFTGYRWPLPDAVPGPWVDAPVDPCRRGIHACRESDLPFWMGHALYEIELNGDVTVQPTKVVAPRGRLLRRVEEWDGGVRDAYTRSCADRAHGVVSSASPRLADWDAVVEPSVPEGPALLGFIAARISEEAFGPHGYRVERARQAEWLVEHLHLTA